MNLIGRDVRFDFQDAVNVHSGHAKTGRDSGKEERTETRNVDLKPCCLIGRSRSGSGGHKGFPRRLETSSEVSGKRKRTAGVLQTGNITLLSHRLFIPCFLRFPVRSAYLFTLASVAASWGDYIFSLPMRCPWMYLVHPSVRITMPVWV